MTEPTTEAGRRLGQRLWSQAGQAYDDITPDIIAIEDEARHQGYDESKAIIGAAKTEASRRIREARADALREAAERVRALMASAKPEPDDTPEMQAYQRVVEATVHAILGTVAPMVANDDDPSVG